MERRRKYAELAGSHTLLTSGTTPQTDIWGVKKLGVFITITDTATVDVEVSFDGAEWKTLATYSGTTVAVLDVDPFRYIRFNVAITAGTVDISYRGEVEVL